MSLVDKKSQVEQAPMDLCDQLAKIVAAVKAQPQPLSPTALPSEIGALVSGLSPIVSDCQNLSGAYAENKLAFMKALVLGADDIAEAALGVADADAAAPASAST